MTSTSGTAPSGPLLALGPQRRPLLDAEAVLLVDHHDAEAGEPHAFLDERVGADDDVDRAVGQAGQEVAPLGSGHPVRQQGHLQRPVLEEAVRRRHGDALEHGHDGRRVLFGQHLRGRHERTLVASLDGGQQRAHGHHRLARADVALQQPVHRVRSGQVELDLVDDRSLVVRQRERELLVEAGDERARDVVADAPRVAFQRLLPQHQHKLHSQQLVEGQATAGLLLLDHRLRLVDAEQRLLATDEPATGEDVRRARDRRCPAPGSAATRSPPSRRSPRC